MAYIPNVVPYNAWVNSGPVVPKLYWDVYSQEERIKKMCQEIGKCTGYIDYLADIINNVVPDVNNQMSTWNAEITAELAQLKGDLTKLITQLMGSSEDYDVTQGELTATLYAHRNLFRWTTPNGMTIDELNNSTSAPQTCVDLANSGLNCMGLACFSRVAYSKTGLSGVPVDYQSN